MTEQPKIIDHPLYQLLRDGNIEEFNRRKQSGESCQMSGCDFRNLNLQGIDADGLDLSNCYFRQADLRGIDFRDSNLDGASINGARISGAYFPTTLTAEEILLSRDQGTRMRCKSFSR